MRLSKFFTLGIMNKDSDERSVPNGMYRHAENIRVSNSDGSNAGLVENIKGTKLLAQLNNLLSLNPFSDARTIGVGTDSYSGCIYYLVWTNSDDYLIEYNTITNQVKRILQHRSVLNLNKDYLVSEIHVIRDSYSGNVFLTWTDNYNPPRFVNLERAKTYPAQSFTEDDISLIKKPPRYEPKILMLSSPTTKENNIEDKFLSFATRFKYLDGEYSALSSFSNYAFSPKQFNLDFATKENVGMVNQFNAVKVSFDTGSKRVTDIDLVFKESGSNSIYKVQTFNKENEGWGHDSEQSFTFINDKVYSMLPEKELYRLFDSVPLKAKDMTVIDNRLVFGGITEGRNMIDVNGQPVKPKYELSLVGGEIVNTKIPVTAISIILANIHLLHIDFAGIELKEGYKVQFHVVVQEPTLQGFFEGDFEFILPSDFQTLSELVANQSFVDFVESVWTNNFLDGYDIELPDHSEVTSTNGFQISGVTGTKLIITPPKIFYRTDNTPNNPSDNNYTNGSVKFRFSKITSANLSNYAVSSSLKSNRSYEVGVVYMDEHNRQSPTFVDRENTIFVPIDRATYKNQIQVSLKNKAPKWADRYKYVLKTNKFGHETIYISNFYFDGAYVWCLLDGANKNKVKDGDTLIVKSDVTGVRDTVIKTKILEIKEQPKGFLTNNEDTENNIIEGEAGLYMKIRPNGFSMGISNQNQAVYNGSGGYRNNYPIETTPEFGEYNDTGDFVPFKITSGSRVRIYIRLWRHGGGTAFDIIYDQTLTVNADYNSYKEWFEQEVDLSSFELEVTTDSNVSADDYINPYEYGTGYGFTEEGKRFWVRHLGSVSDNNKNKLYTDLKWEVYTAETNNIIFETEPKELDVDIYYETGQTFDIVDGHHKGNIQDQTDSQNAVVLLDAFNCFVMGNGAESYKIKDDFNGNSLNIDLRPTTTLNDEYKERYLFSTFTWGGNYEELTQYNSLNEFNRSTLNIKQLDDKYGAIQRMIAMENSLICFQDDKISQLLYRRKALFNQDGSANVGATDVDFGDQIPFTGNYGVSQNPESIAIDKRRIYFTDRKRGVVCRLSLDGIEEIPGYYYETGNIRRETMSTWFRELFRSYPKVKCFGVYDPEYDEYVVSFQNPDSKSILEGLHTISYSQSAASAGGWTSFYSYTPDMMVSLNGKLYGFENGNLYIFNEDAQNRNTYFGKSCPSKIVGIFNEMPNDVKVFNALNIEGNKVWDVKFHTNLTKGHLSSSEFRKIESEWYANFRRDETLTYNSLATQGIGISSTVELGRIQFTMPINNSVSVGDSLYMNDFNILIGKITNINGNELTYIPASSSNSSVKNAPLVGAFFFAQKSARIEGGAIRGYFMEMELTVSGKDRVELYSVNAEISKSFP